MCLLLLEVWEKLFLGLKKGVGVSVTMFSHIAKLSFPHAKRSTRIKRQALYDLKHMTKVFSVLLASLNLKERPDFNFKIMP